MAVAVAQPQQPPALQRQHLETQPPRLPPQQQWQQPLHPKSNAHPTKKSLSIPQLPKTHHSSSLPQQCSSVHVTDSVLRFLVLDVHLHRSKLRLGGFPAPNKTFAQLAIFMLRLLRVRSMPGWVGDLLVGWFVLEVLRCGCDGILCCWVPHKLI